MRTPRSVVAAVVVAVLFAVAGAVVLFVARGAEGAGVVAVARPALTVEATTPRVDVLPITISANGDVMAWQEASIGAEANGLRLATVSVDVGDVVRRGQVVAVFQSDTISAELEQSRAAVSEAEATLAEATDIARRARNLQTTGAMSEQQILQYVTAALTARARLEAARAAESTQRIRLAQTRVRAPDEGVISARSATVGAVPAAGEELFRLIRRGRLEWRAEVAASDLARLKPGQVAYVTPVGGDTSAGRLRVVAPTVDAETRYGLVYVDLPPSVSARAGMFARGEFDLGTGRMLTLPQSAVQMRDGFSYVMRIDANAKVVATRVTVGSRVGERIAITGGLEASARVVASGGAFLGDGDLVRVVEGPSASEGSERASGSAPTALPRGATR